MTMPRNSGLVFRRAAKGAHPNLNPGDPEAGLKFRRIVRASEILTDSEQRAAYDHLLELARIEQRQVAKHAVARTVYKVASGVIAFAVASIVWAGGYAVFMQLNSGALAPAKQVEVTKFGPTELAAAATATLRDTNGENPPPPEKTDGLRVTSEALVPAALMLPTDSGGASGPDIGPPLDLTASDARALREHGIFAYRSGDLSGAVADFDRAIQLDPKFAPAYIDRGIVFYRLRRLIAPSPMSRTPSASKNRATSPPPSRQRRRHRKSRGRPRQWPRPRVRSSRGGGQPRSTRRAASSLPRGAEAMPATGDTRSAGYL